MWFTESFTLNLYYILNLFQLIWNNWKVSFLAKEVIWHFYPRLLIVFNPLRYTSSLIHIFSSLHFTLGYETTWLASCTFKKCMLIFYCLRLQMKGQLNFVIFQHLCQLFPLRGDLHNVMKFSIIMVLCPLPS